MRKLVALLCLVGLGESAAWAQTSEDIAAQTEAEQKALVDACLADAVREAPPGTRVEDLRAWCQSEQPSGRELNEQSLRARLSLEEYTQYNPFVITPHYRNYILPVSYWDNPQWNDPARAAEPIDRIEAKFQISIKTPLVDDILGGSTLYGAFTRVSFWQVYNVDVSKPFRETNYQPELFLSRPLDWQLGPIDSELLSFGYMHQSNGKDVPISRSWERLFLNYIMKTGSWYVSIKPWWRIPEDKKESPTDRTGDDNPDIEHYLGHFELTLSRPFRNHVAELMVRNNLRSDNKGAAQIDYSFPLTRRFKGLVQIFTGYGDSLINYDDYETRYSIGILLTDSL
jgi:phospholipase A1